MAERSFYASVGVDPHKKNVHSATGIFDKGLLPGAFCKVYRHPALEGKAIFGHADGPGTMASAAYKMWKEGWPIDVLKRPSVAAFRMNSEDAGCAGLLGPFGMVNSVNRNPWTVPGAEPLEMILQGLKDCAMFLESHGITVIPVGGETADVGALQTTYNIDVVFYMIDAFDPAEVIDASNMVPGQVLLGLGSFGQCEGETEVNSGVRANGITGLENGLLSSYYAEKYPETVPWKMPKDRVYQGKFRLDDPLPGDGRFTIGSALTCEVRTFMVYLKRLFERIEKKRIGGIVHPTGGGLTKIGGLGPEDNCYIFDDLFELQAIYRVARSIPGMTDEGLTSMLNCGVGLILAVLPGDLPIYISLAESMGIPAQRIGHVARKDSAASPRVLVCSAGLEASHP